MSKFKVGFYIRVSTEEQADNPEGSIKNQEERLKRWVNHKNEEGRQYEVAGVYVDRARSGKDTNRPELQRLLGDIKSKKVNLVMVTELSRLSRSIKDFSDIWDLMQKLKCAFQSLNESFDTTSPAGEMLMFNLVNMAQFERKQTVQRIKAAILARSQRGLYNGGRVPLGYRLMAGKRGYLEVDPDGAALVKECFQTFLKERTLSKTAKVLNSRGFVIKKECEGGGSNKRLGFFTFDGVYRILRNRAYLGLKTYQDKDDNEIDTKAVWDGIIDEETFKRAREILGKNYRRNRRSQYNRYPYLLTGLVYCGECGGSLWGKSATGNGGKVPYYEHGTVSKHQTVLGEVKKCIRHRFPGKKLEDMVWAEIKKLLTDPKMARNLIDIAHRNFKKIDKSFELKQIEKRLRTVQEKMDNLIDRISDLPKDVSADLFYRQIQKLEHDKDALHDQRHFMESNQAQDLPNEFKGYTSFLKGLKALSERESAETRVRVLQNLLHKVELHEDKINLFYYVGTGKNRAPHFFTGHGSNSVAIGDHGRDRTCDPQFRKLVLYPTELRGQFLSHNF